jgi:hypothetical protein
MFSKGPQVRTLLLVALFLFTPLLFALDDDGQLNDDPGAIDSSEYNEDAPPEIDAVDVEVNQVPEHAEYPVEETHQVLKYVQERADAPKYSREPKVVSATAPEIVIKKTQVKKPIKIKKRPIKKRPKTRHSK